MIFLNFNRLVLLAWMWLFIITTLGASLSEESFSFSGNVYENSAWVDEHLAVNNLSEVRLWNTLGDFESSIILDEYVGSITTQPFVTTSSVAFYTGGDFQNQKIRLGLRDLESGEELLLKPLGGIWGVELRRWVLPKSWNQREVVLFAEDLDSQQSPWIGISEIQKSIPNRYRYEQTLDLLRLWGYSALPVFVFFSIGVAGFILLTRWWGVANEHVVLIVFAVPFVVSYGFFYIAFLSISIVVAGVICITAISLSIIVSEVLSIDGRKRLSDAFGYYRVIFALVTLSYILSSSVLNQNWSPLDVVKLAQTRFLWSPLPLDNYLSLLTVDSLFSDSSLKPYILEWRLTDRPPLQAASFLLVRPFCISSQEAYQGFLCFQQVSVLFGIAYFLKQMEVEKKKVLLICSAVVFSGTFLINSIFVWSKLIPVLFLFIAMGLLFGRRKERHSLQYWLMVGSAFGLSILFHPGSIFAIFPMLVVYVVSYRQLSMNQVIAAGIVFCVFILPWVMFQNHYDPPGNMLQKRFLANHPQFDDLSLKEALIDGYGSLTLREWVDGRLKNFHIIIGNFELAFKEFLTLQFGRNYFILRECQFTFIGLASIPWVVAFPFAFMRGGTQVLKRLCMLKFLVVILLGLLLWSLAILPAGITIVHHGSYMFPLLITVFGCICAFRNQVVFSVFYVLNLVTYAGVWIFPMMLPLYEGDAIYDRSFVNPLSLLISLLSIVSILSIVICTRKDKCGQSDVA